VVFCGARGSGKSTQLRRLAEQLRGEWEYLLVDLAPVLPDRASTLQIVVHAGIAMLARLEEWGRSPNWSKYESEHASARTAFGDALQSIVGTVDLGALVAGISPLLMAADASGVAAASGGLLASGWKVLQDRLRPNAGLARAPKLVQAITGEDVAAAQEIARQVSRIAGVLHEVSEQPVVLLVDGLDRTQRLEDVRAAFEDVSLLRDLDVAMVLTAPTNLRHDVRFAGLRADIVPMVLFNFPVVDKAGAPREDGLEPLVQIMRARLGASAAFCDEDGMRQAALESSGIPRDCLSLYRDAVLIAEEAGDQRVTLAHLRSSVRQARLTLQQPLTSTDLRHLGRVLRSHRIGDSDREQELLYENYIACYPNENAYFRPHEMLAGWIADESRVEAPED
jgi:hypothetical protein